MEKKKEMGKVLEFKPRRKGRINPNRNVRAVPKEQLRSAKQKKQHNTPTSEGGLLDNKTKRNITYFLLLCFILYVFKNFF